MADMKKPPYNKHNLQEQPMEFFSEKFREADPYEISERLKVTYRESEDGRSGVFSVRMLGTDYEVKWPEFGTEPEIGDGSAKVVLLRYLLYAKVDRFNGEFISFRDMPSGDLYIQPFSGRCLMRLNRKYGSRIDAFCRAMEGIGAAKVNYASACYDVELFDQLYVRFILWEGDEEFPSSSQILFSENFKKAFETYDLAEIGGGCLNKLGAWEREHANG